MAWNTPVTPVPGTVITTAWAQGTIIDNLSWLRVLTGNGDPPGTGYVGRSTSSTGVSWYDIDGALAVKMSTSSSSAATIADGSTPGFYYSPTPTDSPLGSGVGLWNFITTRYSANFLSQIASSIGDNANLPDLYYRLVTSGTPSSWAKIWHSANDGAGTGLDADTLDGVQLSAIAQVPSGLVAMWTTGTAPTGWVFHTDMDNRFPLGAGSSFTLGNTGGATTHEHSIDHTHAASATGSPGSGAVQSGGASTANPGNHTHTIPALGAVNSATVNHMPPYKVINYIRNS